MFNFEMQKISGNIVSVDRKVFPPMRFAIIFIRTIFISFEVEKSPPL